MNDAIQNRKLPKWISLTVGIFIFAALMGIRDAFESIWIRALVAACAFIVLTLTINAYR